MKICWFFCHPLPLPRANMTDFIRSFFTKMGSTFLHITDDNSITGQARDLIFFCWHQNNISNNLSEIIRSWHLSHGSSMVKNLCIDANIYTLGAFLSEKEPFYWCLFWPGGHIGRHFEFMGHNFTIHAFWLFQNVVDQGQKHTPRCYYFYSSVHFFMIF